jgi:hypothetical protein
MRIRLAPPELIFHILIRATGGFAYFRLALR